MPDDPVRPASGQQSDPRPAAGAPAWWGALGRPDLPLDGDVEVAPLRPAPPAHSPTSAAPARRPPRHWRTWTLNAAVVVVAVLIICVGTGALSGKMVVTIALIFGVPLVLAGLTATVVARRSR